MVVLAVHNYYQQPGGEDRVFADETALLEKRGNKVVRYTRHNDEIDPGGTMGLAARTVWSSRTYREIRGLIRRFRPSIMHVHNTLPLISPAAYYAAKAEGTAVVQTLHNYRLFCPAANFFRQGAVCEACIKKTLPWPSVRYRCYRDSRAATATVASMIAAHRLARTWSRRVDIYIAPSAFAREKIVECGFPSHRVCVKSNFVWPDPGEGEGEGGYGLFVGRLSEEKGVRTLLRAAERLGTQMPIMIIGDGPLASLVADVADRVSWVSWLGWKPPGEVLDLIGAARFVIMPSEWYEVAPRVIFESFAKGTPILAANIGAVGDLVASGSTGLHFEPGNDADLATKCQRLHEGPHERKALRQNARAEYLANYTEAQTYSALMDLYDRARSVAVSTSSHRARSDSR